MAKFGVCVFAMQQPVNHWPRGATAGVLLALFLAIPLFAAILADVNASGDADAAPKVAEAGLPVAGP